MKNHMVFKNIIILIVLLINSCEKNLNSIEEHNWKGSILVDIRYLRGNSMIVSSPSSEDESVCPRNPVTVDLKIRPENQDELITIETKITDPKGYVLFDSLKQNTYYIYPCLSEEIGKIISGESSISFDNQNDTIKTWIGYKWGFSQYEFEINSATSILAHINEDTIKYNYFNIAIDTIFCKYDLSQVPEWLDLTISKSVCPPFGTELDTFNLDFNDLNYDIPYYAPIISQLCYRYNDIPKNKMNSSFQIPVTHQFKTEYFTFTLNLPE
jgi:hypothetical protein